MDGKAKFVLDFIPGKATLTHFAASTHERMRAIESVTQRMQEMNLTASVEGEYFAKVGDGSYMRFGLEPNLEEDDASAPDVEGAE